MNRFSSFSTTYDVDTAPVSGFIHMLTLLVERGLYSKQPYMAHVNHRDVNFIFVNQGENGRQSLIESIVSDSQGDSFDGGDKICVTLHGVEHKKTTEILDRDRFRSPNCMNATISKELSAPGRSRKSPKYEDVIKNGLGYAQDKTVTDISEEGFRRLLLFFNMKWVNGDGKAVEGRRPTEQELHSLLLMLAEYDLRCSSGFKKMLEDFSLTEMFSYDDDDSIYKNLAQFGHFLRALVPVRLGVYEGQHRFYLLLIYLHGYYVPSNDVPLKKTSFKKVHKADPERVRSTESRVSLDIDDLLRQV